MARMSDGSGRRWPPAELWALSLGIVGFAAGFFGPIALNPDANQGPLLGIFVTGPGGLLGGFVLGALFRALPITNVRRVQALVTANAALLLGTLYLCLPQPAPYGLVIQGTLARCQSPEEVSPEAIPYWQDRIAAASWAKARDGWRGTAETQRNFASDDGASCAKYAAGLPTLFVRYRQSSAVWPPDDLPGLLNLARIERATEQYLTMTN
ncbi:MAG TPA: hypothetical protein VFK60_02600 [Casimicrobiaceae bacterium]|nr:hypothetical protein [Casimicrobiaceae bacterium]